jgi:hypothetical protein
VDFVLNVATRAEHSLPSLGRHRGKMFRELPLSFSAPFGHRLIRIVIIRIPKRNPLSPLVG